MATDAFPLGDLTQGLQPRESSGGGFVVVFLVAACITLAFLLVVILARRALPILCAASVAWLAWLVTRDFAAVGVASIAALLVACWLFDAAASQGITRRLTVGAEIVAAAFVAGGLAFLIAGGPGPNTVWIVGGAAIAAIAIVVRWRELAF